MKVRFLHGFFSVLWTISPLHTFLRWLGSLRSANNKPRLTTLFKMGRNNFWSSNFHFYQPFIRFVRNDHNTLKQSHIFFHFLKNMYNEVAKNRNSQNPPFWQFLKHKNWGKNLLKIKVYENKNACLENISSRLTLGLSLVDRKKQLNLWVNGDAGLFMDYYSLLNCVVV